MISFVPSTPIGVGLFILIMVLGPKRGLWALFIAMPFGATAVLSGQGIGNVTLLDFCAVAFVLATVGRLQTDEILRSIWPGQPGFVLLMLCCLVAFGAYFLPRIFAGDVSVYAVQTVGSLVLIDLVTLEPSSAQIAQTMRFFLGALVFLAIVSIEWQLADCVRILRAVTVASCAHVLVSLADWISFPLGLAHLLDPMRTIFQAILVDQQFGPVRRIIGGHTEPASFGIYTIGLLGFWLRLWVGRQGIKGAGPWLFALAVLAMRSTSTATILTLTALVALTVCWHLPRLGQSRFWITAYIVVIALIPLTVFGGMAMLNNSTVFQSLVDALFLNKATSESGLERFSWNWQALENFRHSYGLGLGMGSVRASSWVFAVLGNLGLPGTLLFVWFLIAVLVPKMPRTLAPGPADEIAPALRFGCHAILLQSALTTPYPNLGLPFFAMCGLSVAISQAKEAVLARNALRPSRMSVSEGQRS